MAYKFQENSLGWQPIADTSTTQKHKLGTIMKAVDPTYGGGEFIYLKGVGSTIVGSIVSYDDSFQTALHSAALDHPRPVAVAMSANGASAYAWYQIGGLSVMAKGATTSFAKGAALGTGSGLAVVVATGSILNGALVAVVASAKSGVTTVAVMVNRPHDTSDVS